MKFQTPSEQTIDQGIALIAYQPFREECIMNKKELRNENDNCIKNDHDVFSNLRKDSSIDHLLFEYKFVNDTYGNVTGVRIKDSSKFGLFAKISPGETPLKTNKFFLCNTIFTIKEKDGGFDLEYRSIKSSKTYTSDISGDITYYLGRKPRISGDYIESIETNCDTGISRTHCKLYYTG